MTTPASNEKCDVVDKGYETMNTVQNDQRV